MSVNSRRASSCFVTQVMWLTFCTAIVGYVPDAPFKRWLNQRVLVMCFAVLSSALSSVITYHNPENRPKTGICVANHTSPIDALVLMCDNCYSLVRFHSCMNGLFSMFFISFHLACLPLCNNRFSSPSINKCKPLLKILICVLLWIILYYKYISRKLILVDSYINESDFIDLLFCKRFFSKTCFANYFLMTHTLRLLTINSAGVMT